VIFPALQRAVAFGVPRTDKIASEAAISNYKYSASVFVRGRIDGTIGGVAH
jgi:hypothetical protein